jgi:hypothetical protein
MTFQAQNDLWKALHEGMSITNTDFEGHVCLEDGELMQVVNGKSNKIHLGFCAPELWSLGNPSNWYDYIPEHGVLCLVGAKATALKLIKSVDDKGRFVDDSGFKWESAEPVTPDGAAKYLYQGAENA